MCDSDIDRCARVGHEEALIEAELGVRCHRESPRIECIVVAPTPSLSATEGTPLTPSGAMRTCCLQSSARMSSICKTGTEWAQETIPLSSDSIVNSQSAEMDSGAFGEEAGNLSKTSISATQVQRNLGELDALTAVLGAAGGDKLEMEADEEAIAVFA